jgi:hypothetical protein|tara:strand:+ start:125 stop:433 length:309 start_codon:yes stop_codon:yes gene_type:complete
MLPYYKKTIPCDWCGEHTHGRILERDILCGSCKKVIINDWEKGFNENEPERYHEWILWKFRKENYREGLLRHLNEKGNKDEARADNTWSPWNRKDNDSSEHS